MTTTTTRSAASPLVSTIGYATSMAGEPSDADALDSQRTAIEGACRKLDLRLVDVVCDELPGDNHGNGQPGLTRVLERIESGEVSCLVVGELERLTPQTARLETVLDQLERAQGRLVAVDVGLDSATETGRRATGLGAPAPVAKPAPVPVAKPAPAAKPAPVAKPPPAPPEPQPAPIVATRALGYASVPADIEGSAGELEAQRTAIELYCERHGVRLNEVVREREPKSGKALDRAGLSFLIERIAAGDASCVVVVGLHRLSRSVAELGTIVQWLERNDVRLIAVELDLDTASPGGKTTARAIASVAGWEHERLSERTRKGLAAARAKRHASSGTSSPDWASIRKRIATMRADGMTLQAIADTLNAEGVPTQRGGKKWRPSSVQTAAGYKRRSRAKDVHDLPTVGRRPQPRPPQ